MQICMMDSSDWLKGIVHDDSSVMGSSSPSPGELISCTRPAVVDRRPLRPQHDQALKCPRCDSTHTKFCYYNNYSLSQPRYFCKTCRRYWTKGGSLRNVPVGGGCRKNKRSASKKPAEPCHPPPSLSFQDATNLQLSFPMMQLPQLSFLTADTPCSFNYIECKYSSMLGNSVDGLDLFKNNEDAVGLQGEVSHGFSSEPSGIFQSTNTLACSIDRNNGALMEACHRLRFPFEVNEEEPNAVEMKPGDTVLSLHWHDQCSADAGRQSTTGYSNRLGSWAGMINDHDRFTTI